MRAAAARASARGERVAVCRKSTKATGTACRGICSSCAPPRMAVTRGDVSRLSKTLAAAAASSVSCGGR